LKTALQQHKSGFAFFTVRDQGERSNAAETLNLNGSLSYADIDRFETDLNNLSEKISKSAER